MTRHIGNVDTELVWEVTHAPGKHCLTCCHGQSSTSIVHADPAAGSKLILTVVDSSGSFGGIPPRPFDVIRKSRRQYPFPDHRVSGLRPERSGKAKRALANPRDISAGVSTSCVRPEPSSPSFTISANKTGGANLETCEPWGVTIKGGIPPYNLSIAAVNSPVVTNVSIPSGFDAFTYINRADPNGQMVSEYHFHFLLGRANRH